MTDGAKLASENEALTQFAYLVPVGMVLFDRQGRTQMINPQAVQVLVPVSPTADMDDIIAALAPLVPDLAQRLAAHDGPATPVIDQRRITATIGGTKRILNVSVNQVGDDQFLLILDDITKTVEQERRIFSDAQRFRAIFDHVRDYAIYTIGLDGRVESWNRSINRLGQWQEADVVNRHMSLFFPPEEVDRAAVDHILAKALEAGSYEVETWRRRRDGSRFWGNTVVTVMPDPDGVPDGYVVVTRDMTERKRMEDELQRLALSDPMTGAGNRRFGMMRLREEISRFERDGTALSVALVDIDHFKQINDTHGHGVGDDVLTGLVRMLDAVVRRADIVVRWGGEEFLVILPNTSADAAHQLAERARDMIARWAVDSPGQQLRVTVSIGVAMLGQADGGEEDALLQRADAALYQAKEAGRNRVAMAPPAVRPG
jgi:diguanylate cyclase (GGDEF)-like protein/PAS domain S-box-containing protein